MQRLVFNYVVLCYAHHEWQRGRAKLKWNSTCNLLGRAMKATQSYISLIRFLMAHSGTCPWFAPFWYILYKAIFSIELELYIFLHKHDPKYNQTFAQVPKVDKGNPIKQVRYKYFLSFIYSGKWSNIAYLWMAKVCESLGLAANLKVKWECRGVFSQCNDYLMPVHDLFYSKNRDLSKSDHVCGSESWTKEITEDLWKRVDVAHQARKPSLKSLDSTNPQSDRLCSNGGNSRPLLPSREVLDQQRSLQSRTCNSLRGCRSSQGNL